MAAGINDRFTEATNGTRPVPTTLTALRAVAATSISCGALTGWPTATAVHFIIYTTDVNGNKVAGSQIDCKGIVSGTTIGSIVYKAGTDNGNSIGAVVEAAPTAAWANDMADGIAAQHNQDGTHAIVTATSLTTTGTIQGATLISTGDIQRRSISTETIDSERTFDFVASGCVWSGDSYGATRAASMTAGTVYISGRRVTVALVTARTFTASKDTYIDVDNTGTITYTEVTNNAASPALTAGNIRLGVIVTAAGSIAAAGSVNQGQENIVLPIASSTPYAVTDSLGNLICSRDPNRRILGYRQAIANQTTTSGTYADITGLTVPVIIPAGRKVKIEIRIPNGFNGTSGSGGGVTVNDVTAGTVLSEATDVSFGANAGFNLNPSAIYTASASGARTFKGQVKMYGAASTFNVNGVATGPVFISVELV